ncbi:hypothetical protein K439DRAFT_1640169 [Ramaria rubella]|nr:hypothetical protein K439DRAFT_1640169 [Ramaria rubella]
MNNMHPSVAQLNVPSTAPTVVKRDTSLSDKPLRASSQMPQNSFLYKFVNSGMKNGRKGSDESELRADSPGPRPPDPDTDDSVNTHCQKRKAKRKWEDLRDCIRWEQSAVKAEAPFIYYGEPKLDIFQKWTYECVNYLESSQIRSKDQVKRLKKYVKGRAYTFFELEIIMTGQRWDLKTFFEEIFNYCFLPNFCSEQRKRLTTFVQWDLPVRNYARQIRALANSIGDISERQLTVYFWNGAHRKIQERWATEKFNPEFSTLNLSPKRPRWL